MASKLDRFVADARAALTENPGSAGREKVRDLVKQALADQEFVATWLLPNTEERHVLYEDPDLGFTVLAHSHTGAKSSSPHDHGPSWAIYGQAAGETIMTDWDCLARPTETTPGQVKFRRDYVMKPGDAYFYDVGVLHSPERKAATKLLRIEGQNMARVKRRPYVQVSQAAE